VSWNEISLPPGQQFFLDSEAPTKLALRLRAFLRELPNQQAFCIMFVLMHRGVDEKKRREKND
jgi:hypothetical protein